MEKYESVLRYDATDDIDKNSDNPLIGLLN